MFRLTLLHRLRRLWRWLARKRPAALRPPLALHVGGGWGLTAWIGRMIITTPLGYYDPYWRMLVSPSGKAWPQTVRLCHHARLYTDSIN